MPDTAPDAEVAVVAGVVAAPVDVLVLPPGCEVPCFVSAKTPRPMARTSTAATPAISGTRDFAV